MYNMLSLFLALSVICAGTWSGLMAGLSDLYCWTVDVHNLGLQWINDSLRIALLFVSKSYKLLAFAPVRITD
jgi:hypothetical protein